MRELRVDGAGGIADDRGKVHDGIDAVERRRACLRVAHISSEDLHAALAEPGRDSLLVVQQDVEHANLVAGGKQLLDGQGADVAGSTGDGDLHWGETSAARWASSPSSSWRTWSNSRMAFS